MLGDGLQGTLLAVRADQEGFTTTMTGLVMSSFYVGFLCGSVATPKMMAQVGHVRVFAALAALASAAILIHAVFVQVAAWIVLRLISGFCFAGLYVVAESWLNDRATNETRGKVLSLYMLVTYAGVGIGQLFLNLAEPKAYPLFILSSVLISVAVIPLLLSATSSPRFEESVSIKLKVLYKRSPLGVFGMFIVGLVTATFFALGPVYAQRIGLELKDISYFMAAAVVGTLVLQWPIGALSDRYDRRTILTIVALLTAVAAFACVPLSEQPLVVLLPAIGIFCGLAFPLYSVCIAHTNDHLNPNQMVAASGSLVLIGGFGAVVGPIFVALVMDYAGHDSFFVCMGVAHLLTGVFALYRMARRSPTPLNEQGVTTPTAARYSGIAIEGKQHAPNSSGQFGAVRDSSDKK